MKQVCTILILWIFQFILSCNNVDSTKHSKRQLNETNKIKLQSEKVFNVNAEAILKDFKTWYNYTYFNIHLARDFIGLDTDSSTMTKTDFLTRLTKGKLVPLKTGLRNNLPIYKLYKLTNNNPDIRSTIKQLASIELSNCKMEGKELPSFNFTDINGKLYNKSTTHQKIVVLKCWFIHCVACVKEFPELNKLVDEYKQSSDILFISLAMDSKQDLIPFLKKRQFKYAVVPEKETYMLKDLGISIFPTHVLIGKNGKIVKVVNAVDDLIPFLRQETAKSML